MVISLILTLRATPLSLSEQKRTVEACDGNRDEFDGHQQPAHHGVGRRRRQNKMQPQKLRRLCRRRFPRWEQKRKEEDGSHAREHLEVERFVRQGSFRAPRDRRGVEWTAACCAVS